MSEPIILFEKVSKRYLIGRQPEKGDGLRHVIERMARNPISWFRTKTKSWREREEEFWALKDVSFEVKRGEVVGIIGRNGAGKSTLLKILSRITEPTQGRIRLNGRVACLLEVGTGFHPELTGRENIFLNGAILGMSKSEIQRKFDEIVAFSEVEKFLDTPVKRYSSGMYVRLAFAVAAHLEPEILVVDEVLAVGDAAFQTKCLGKMGEVAKGGRTVLFVSHNMAAIENLCHRAILLKNGRITENGPAPEIIRRYVAGISNRVNVSLADRTDRKGAGEVRVTTVETLDGQEQPIQYLVSGQTTVFRVHYSCTASRTLKNCRVIITVRKDDRPYIMLSTEVVRTQQLDLSGDGHLDYTVPDLPLSAGEYGLDFYIESNGTMQDALVCGFPMSVIDGDFYGSGRNYPEGWQGQYVLVRFSLRLGKGKMPELSAVLSQ
ncbi:MAG TPA: ABC transporter ATP-binding protein [Verrucomicrobiae bacterium]|nr:ABC transporter ATP-binding protein [Verrucomicrobiae bacterium]